jgi:NADH:ubiquinone oxidoreductase subunit 3 (subunit A)
VKVISLDLLIGFTLVIVLSLVFAAVILLIGRAVAPQARLFGGAVESYACGEPTFLGGKIQFNLELFNYALFFMLFDIVGFILFLSWANPSIIVVVYLVMTLVASAYVSVSPQND